MCEELATLCVEELLTSWAVCAVVEDVVDDSEVELVLLVDGMVNGILRELWQVPFVMVCDFFSSLK